MWRPSVVGSPRSARVKTGCATSCRYSRRITTFVSPMPAYTTPPPAPAHQGHGLREAMAPLYASDGSRVDRLCLEPERGLAVSGATVAPASGGVSTPRGGKRHGGE